VPVLAAMERQGWTVRKTGESDRPVRRLHLTAEGEAILAELKRRFAEQRQRVLQRLDGVDTHLLLTAAPTRRGLKPSGDHRASRSGADPTRSQSAVAQAARGS